MGRYTLIVFSLTIQFMAMVLGFRFGFGIEVTSWYWVFMGLFAIPLFSKVLLEIFKLEDDKRG